MYEIDSAVRQLGVALPRSFVNDVMSLKEHLCFASDIEVWKQESLVWLCNHSESFMGGPFPIID